MKSVFFIIKGNTSSNSDEVLVEVKQGRNHFIGGKFDENETLVQAGLRESFEEVIGLDRRVIKSSLESWLKTEKNFNILDLDGIPEFEQHFVEIYSDIERIRINPEGEVKELKTITIEKLLEDPYNNTHAVNAWLYMNYLRTKARGRIPQHWNAYISKIRSGENPFESKVKYHIIMIGGIKSSGKSKLYEELNNILSRSKYDNRLILIEEDLISYYEGEKYICPEAVIKELASQANCVIMGNQHHKYATKSIFIKDDYDAWRGKMTHRLDAGRINSKSSSQKDSDLLKMTRSEFETYYKERKVKAGNPEEMEYSAIKSLVLNLFPNKQTIGDNE